MTDIVARLRDRSICQDDTGIWLYAKEAIPIMHEAADEIERLLGTCKDKAELLKHAYTQIDHMREEHERLERAYKQLRETYLASQVDKDDGDHRFDKDTYS